jgi:hypothetical protein
MFVESQYAESEVRHLLLASQAFFFLAVVMCAFINHSLEAETNGISFYGVYHRTIAIIVLGYCAASYGLWRTSAYFARAGISHLTVRGMRVVSLGLIALLLTPYNKGTFFNWAHMSVGVVMALIELAIAIQLMVAYRSWQAVSAFIVQLSGGVWAAASLPYLLQGEFIFEVGFSWCLLEWTYALYSRRARALAFSR